ncbi:MAG: hypothetical protein HYU39_04025 [Thaumarchaeota archaeon]|nr:hypothetical protein [Nitrososphaerota archaeon]
MAVMVRRKSRSFLDLSVKERNLVADALEIVKMRFKRNFTISQLGFRSTWDNVDCTALLQKDLMHYVRLVRRSRMSPEEKRFTLKALNTIFSLMALDSGVPERRG